MKKTAFILCLFTLCFCSSEMLFAQHPVIKVDINQTGRPENSITETGYVPWPVKSGEADSLTLEGVKIRFKRMGSAGTGLASDWYKAGAEGNTKLISDGITVKDGNAGGQIEMRITGLPEGNHTLLVYLNAVQNHETNTFSPINIFLNGELIHDKFVPSKRATATAEAAFSYLDITAEENKDVVLLFAADITSSANIKNVVINGFEINTGNILRQSGRPFPAHGDEHVEVINGELQLSWNPANGTLSHDIYFGTDEQTVFSANHSSSEYKGNQTDTIYSASGLYSMDTYYWRIDEVSASGTVKGNVWYFRPGQLAFLGAEGFGRYARGGRGGKVVEVTNLNDSGPGSLREAVTNDIGPRTIVFAVSGVIELQSRLVLNQPYVTIAGQTAPGKGICIRKSPFGIGANDAVIRNIRLRLGAGETADGMGLGGDYSIMDHCSISWTIDEAFSSRGGKNITLQRTLISEALNSAGHKNYPEGTEHGYAATISGNKGSFHHNLLAHCYGRNWSLGGGLDGNGYFSGKLDIRNNVVYNWGNRATDGGANEVNFINNYYKPGAGTTYFYAFNAQHENVGLGTQKCYFNGNVMPGRFDENTQHLGRRESYSNGATKTYETFVDQPFFDAPVTTQNAHHAYKMVLSDVGSNQPYFDQHDIRMINETLTGTFSVRGSKTNKAGFPDHENDSGGYELYPEVYRASNWDSDHDGLPDWWEIIHGLNPNSAPNDFSDANADNDRNGYTNLDDYLQWMAEPHFNSVSGEPVVINIKTLSRGFSNAPVYSISNVVNGNASLNQGEVEFTPDATGLSSFEFTVTDTESHSMTRKVNILSGFDLTLPVTLVAFEANRKNSKEVVLKWKTVQESNNSHFEVLKSDKTVDFKNLGVKINSKAPEGKSLFPLHYDFIDHNDNANDTYYQLVQKDKDGQTAYSEIKIVKGNGTAFNVWPIPSKGELYVFAGDLKDSAGLYVYDTSGRQILHKNIAPNQTEKITIDAKGIYILKIKSPDKGKELFAKKIVIK